MDDVRWSCLFFVRPTTAVGLSASKATTTAPGVLFTMNFVTGQDTRREKNPIWQIPVATRE